MGAKKTGELPARLESVRQRLERWRRTRPARTRIPEPLWTAAVKMAEAYGIHRAARALRLDYYSMKKRLEEKEAASGKIPAKPATATFLELAPSPRKNSCECSVEFEDAAGAKMRIQLESTEMPDLAALSRSFWQAEP